MPQECLLTGVAYIVVNRTVPGVVAHLGYSRIAFGETNSGISPRTERVRDMFQRSTIDAQLHADMRLPMWEKFVFLAGTGGVMALTRLDIGQIRAVPGDQRSVSRRRWPKLPR